MNHHTPPPNASSWPSETCRPYAPLLPLLRTGELTDEQAAGVHEHLAGCADCSARLADYDVLSAALRTRFDPDVVAAGARIPSAREIAELSARSPARSSRPALRVARWRLARRDDLEGLPPPARGYTEHWRPPIRLETLAALLLVTLLGGLLAAQRFGVWGGPPPLDGQEQTYVAVLRADYLPLLDAIGADSRQCVTAFDRAPVGDKPQDMADCRPVEVTALSDSQTLLAHLQVTPTPSRWRTADGQLKAWAQAQTEFYTARIQAIDAHRVDQFQSLGDQGSGPADSCPAISQINADLPSDSPLPVNASGYCPG